jgi:glycosyltransferase involved in cell wall biosynthesis
MNQAPSMTILFATHNGADTLPRMLDAFEDLEPPAGGFKIVAVDNASSDDSAAIVTSRAARLPIEVLTELRPGKNVALNKGLTAVEGDLVVLTDDDIIPRPDWLVSIQRVAKEQPDYDIFGGAIYPVWEEAPPDWVLRCCPKGYFAWTDFEEGPVEPICVWGPNMTVRSALFRSHRFFEGIGPDGTRSYVTGSEGEFTWRVGKLGHRCWHSQNSVVGHIIRRHQIEPEWLLQRAYNLTRGWRRLHKPDKPQEIAAVADRDSRKTREIIEAQLRLLRAFFGGSFEEQFKARLRLQALKGDMAELRSWRAQARAATSNGRN